MSPGYTVPKLKLTFKNNKRLLPPTERPKGYQDSESNQFHNPCKPSLTKY